MPEIGQECELWTYAQVAVRVKCCARKLRDDYVKTGVLKAVRLGRSVRFRPRDVEEFIRRLGVDAPRGAP